MTIPYCILQHSYSLFPSAIRQTHRQSTPPPSNPTRVSLSLSLSLRALRSIYAGDTVDEAFLAWPSSLSSFFRVDNRTIFSPSSVSFLDPLIGFPPILFTGVKKKKVILSGNFVFPRFFSFLFLFYFFLISLILVPGQEKKKPLLPNWSKPTLLFLITTSCSFFPPAATCTGIAPSLP